MTLDEPGAVVEIGGRTFVIGTVYTSGRKVMAWRGPAHTEVPRRLLAFDPDYPWLGGRVTTARLEGPPQRRHEKHLPMTGRAWAAWAREEAAARPAPPPAYDRQDQGVRVEHVPTGRRFRSIMAAATAEGMSPGAMRNRLSNPFSGWRRAGRATAAASAPPPA